jgi:hypothetical protein
MKELEEILKQVFEPVNDNREDLRIAIALDASLEYLLEFGRRVHNTALYKATEKVENPEVKQSILSLKIEKP